MFLSRRSTEAYTVPSSTMASTDKVTSSAAAATASTKQQSKDASGPLNHYLTISSQDLPVKSDTSAFSDSIEISASKQHQQQQQQSQSANDMYSHSSDSSNEVNTSKVGLDYVQMFIECKMNEIDALFKDVEEESDSEGCSLCDQLRRESRCWSPTGRLGPSLVVFDINTNVGSLVMDCDRLSVSSQSGFSSIKATTGVFKGKWQYEVMLGSKGVMQVGWATHNCKFSHEKGVGDTVDSYSYDGSRVRKWNLSTSPYGEAWFPGDVIGCTIDLEDGTIDFYRNGHHLGLAFDCVRYGPGFCYFPSVSLTYNESLMANFGGFPFKYPVSGYQPLQETPLIDVAKGDVLINWMFNLLEESNANQITSSSSNSFSSNNTCPGATCNSSNIGDITSHNNLSTLLVSHVLLKYLTPLLSNKFIIEGCLLKKLLSLSTTGTGACNTRLVHSFLDTLWTFYDICVIHDVLDTLTTSLINCYRFSKVYLKRDQLNGTCSLDNHNEHHLDSCAPVYSDFNVKRAPLSNDEYKCIYNTQDKQSNINDTNTIHSTTISMNQLNTNESNLNDKKCFTSSSSSSHSFNKSRIINSSSNTSLYSNTSSSPKISFMAQKKCLVVFLQLIEHSKTRCHLLKHILFEKGKFPFLLDIKPVNEALWLEEQIFSSINLESFIQHVTSRYNCGKNDENKCQINKQGNQPGVSRLSNFNSTIDASTHSSSSSPISFRSSDIECAITELEELHQVILDTLLFQDENCRCIFLTKFDTFLKENCAITPSSRLTPNIENILTQSPLAAVTSFFHRLTSLIRVQYESMVDIIPRAFFLDSSCVSHDTTRLGGLMSHLSKVHERDLTRLSHESHTMNPLLRHVYILIHGLIKLYTSSAHKYLSKHCVLRDRLIEVSSSLACLSNDICDEETIKSRQVTRSVLLNELLSKSHQLGWLNSTALTASKRADVCWLLKLLLNTLDAASSVSCTFSFIPDYYIESCLNLCQALRDFFGYPATTSSSLSSSVTSTDATVTNNCFLSPNLTTAEVKEYHDTINHFARFLCKHFLDDRIVNSDIKDLLTLSLAKFISHADTLRAAESIPIDIRMSMITCLTTQFYESRSWTQTNWILARFWKGDGFAYRFNNVNNSKNCLTTNIIGGKDILSSLNNLKACPSKVFQVHIRDFLTSNPQACNLFLSSLLAQLNWSFSEFIGMLQEIQNVANKPEKVFSDPRQLKVCCTCFDLTVTLLRVIEMVAHLNPLVITSATSSDHSSDLLLGQLCSILNQILSRITTKTGSFEFVSNLDIPGLECVSHFTILSAVCGILIELLLRGPPSSQAAASNALVTDANFLMSNFSFINTCNSQVTSDATCASTSSSSLTCDFTSTNASAIMHSSHLNSVEISQLKQLASLISSQKLSLDSSSSSDFLSDDEVCTICYANKKTAIFVPCGHQSCR